MPHLQLEGGEALRYEYSPPTSPDGVCFVFFNPLTGSLDLWAGGISPALRAEGHGTLLWNLHSQEDSPAAADRVLDTELAIGGPAAVPDITRGSYLFFLKAVIAALLTLLFLEQPVSLVAVLAMGVICGAVFVEPLWPRARGRPARAGA